MKPEKILLIGLGAIAKKHLLNIKKLLPFSIVGVLHHSIKKQTKNKNIDHNFYNLSDAINFNPNAAIICSPANTHIDFAVKLAKKKVNLFIEKPLSINLNKVNKLIDITNNAKLNIMLGYNLKFMSSYIKLKSLLKKKIIGDIYLVNAEVGQYLPEWRKEVKYYDSVSAKKEFGGGALLELSHEINYIYNLFGMPSSVYACGGTYNFKDIDVEDLVTMTMQYEKKNIIVNINLDFIQRVPSRQCKFIGSKGTIIWNLLKNEIEIFKIKTNKWKIIEHSPIVDIYASYFNEIKYFINLISKPKKNISDLSEGIDTIKIIQCSKKSIKLKKEINIKNL